MTGFARLCREIDGISYAVELRTVNNRYFKPSIKLPETAAFLEVELEKLLRQNIYRGSVSCFLKFKNISGEPMFDIDTAALNGYLNKLNGLIESQGSNKEKLSINLADLLVLPGVIKPQEPENQKAEKIRSAVLNITSEAIEQLKKMRAAEGAALAADLKSNCEQIKSKLVGITARRDVVLSLYHDKLKSRVDELLKSARLNLDADTLAREVAILADKSDISEETTRLQSHIEQFISNCNGNSSAAGRKLDFITQEMLREANTIASKASDSQICLDVVEIKSSIERIKEQVQNVE